MQIECPSCHARARLNDAQEGAKVRCGECGRVYVAREAGKPGSTRRANSKGPSSTTIGVLLGGALLALGVVLYIRHLSKTQGTAPVPLAAEPKDSAPLVEHTGWKSDAVQLAVQLHNASYARDRERLASMLFGARIWAEQRKAAGEPGLEADFLALEPEVRLRFYDERVLELTTGSAKDLVSDWQPYDGQVVEELEHQIVLHLDCHRREASGEAALEKRTVEWKLARDLLEPAKRWKAYAWSRFQTPDEIAASKRVAKTKEVQRVTLSDGSVVLERKPEPLGHLEDTPAELRARIDQLYATMIDLDLTKESSRASLALREIGRPAVPILLTGLYQIPLDTEQHAIQVNLIVQALVAITEQDFGYKPQVAEGSGVGTTEERRQSAIRQYFAWWYRNKDKFTGEEEHVDALDALIPLSEKDKAWLERNKDK